MCNMNDPALNTYGGLRNSGQMAYTLGIRHAF